MKVKFVDNVYDKPTQEFEFSSQQDLNALLDQYGHFKYAFEATIYNDDGAIILALFLNNKGNWSVDSKNKPCKTCKKPTTHETQFCSETCFEEWQTTGPRMNR